MKYFWYLFLSIIILSPSMIAKPTYGNWSGIIHTQSVPVREGNPFFHQYTKEIQNYLLRSYRNMYVQLITYVVKKGQKYTLSIKYPGDGIGRSIMFTGYNPYKSKGSAISFQVHNISNAFFVRRINFSNSVNSTYDRVIVIISTIKPNVPVYLKIEYPALSDSIINSSTSVIGAPQLGKQNFGIIIRNPLLLN